MPEPEEKTITTLDHKLAELAQMIAEASGGGLLLDAERYPHMGAHMQMVTGEGPRIVVKPPAKKGEGS